MFLAPGRTAGDYRLADPTFLPYGEPVVAPARHGRLRTCRRGRTRRTVLRPSSSRITTRRWRRPGIPFAIGWVNRSSSGRDTATRPATTSCFAIATGRSTSHTHWDLSVERVGAGSVAPLAHPHVDDAGIRDFFSRNAHRFEVTLKPGGELLPLPGPDQLGRAGWGYKERIGFRYYPMAAPRRVRDLGGWPVLPPGRADRHASPSGLGGLTARTAARTTLRYCP